MRKDTFPSPFRDLHFYIFYWHFRKKCAMIRKLHQQSPVGALLMEFLACDVALPLTYLSFPMQGAKGISTSASLDRFGIGGQR